MANLTSCFKSSVASDAKSISREIEKQLSKDKKEARSQVKLLVLGAAESGKSTFIKQVSLFVYYLPLHVYLEPVSIKVWDIAKEI